MSYKNSQKSRRQSGLQVFLSLIALGQVQVQLKDLLGGHALEPPNAPAARADKFATVGGRVGPRWEGFGVNIKPSTPQAGNARSAPVLSSHSGPRWRLSSPPQLSIPQAHARWGRIDTRSGVSPSSDCDHASDTGLTMRGHGRPRALVQRPSSVLGLHGVPSQNRSPSAHNMRLPVAHVERGRWREVNEGHAGEVRPGNVDRKHDFTISGAALNTSKHHGGKMSPSDGGEVPGGARTGWLSASPGASLQAHSAYQRPQSALGRISVFSDFA